MCDDCQAFARYLGRHETVLDRNGGTDVYQTTPSQVTIADGADRLACVRLSDKGLLRWYTSCCNTPVANTMASWRVPFASILHPFMDHQADGHTRDEALGPIRARIHARFGHGELPADSQARASLGVILGALRFLAGGLIRGRHRPSPFFDAATRSPIAQPTVLSREEREALDQTV